MVWFDLVCFLFFCFFLFSFLAVRARNRYQGNERIWGDLSCINVSVSFVFSSLDRSRVIHKFKGDFLVFFFFHCFLFCSECIALKRKWKLRSRSCFFMKFQVVSFPLSSSWTTEGNLLFWKQGERQWWSIYFPSNFNYTSFFFT